jgi:hypothetical protein
MDLTSRLVAALEQSRERINTEAEVFVGRLSFHVDLDLNVSMRNVQVRVHPCREPCLDKPADSY